MPRSISPAAKMIIEERIRQQTREGYTLAHDDEHTWGQLALLAAYYALSSRREKDLTVIGYLQACLKERGFAVNPKDPIRDLERAGALIVAELERRLRTGTSKEPRHRSDCAVHNEPAYPNGPCDCGAVQLPRWQSHKIVVADKIVLVVSEQPEKDGSTVNWRLACGVNIQVSSYLVSRVPEGVSALSGYYVRYEDGFESWSPAEAFEKGYTRIPEKPAEFREKPRYTDNELIYSATYRCDCGAGLAYPKGCGADHYWDCADILTGRAIPSGQEGSKTHTGRLPFVFWKIKSERQPSAHGATTRPAP